MKFGEILKSIRLKNGDTMQSLATKMGVTHSYIQKIENGSKPISRSCFDNLLLYYTKEKPLLLASYLNENLSALVREELGLSPKTILEGEMESLLQQLEKEDKKMIYHLILEKIELSSLKNGDYDKRKSNLKDLKQKIEDL